MIRTFIFAPLIMYVFTQDDNSALDGHLQCNCMEYWDCIGEGGTPYSYCAYSYKVCCFVEKGATKVGILPKKTKLTACGQKGTNNDKDGISEPDEWSWHAAVLRRDFDIYVCGGSLIDESWILTAAHCIDDFDNPQSLKIRLGEHDVSNADEAHPHQEFQVSRIVIHPEFDNETLENDIALIQISTKAKKLPNVNIVCLPQTQVFELQLLTTASCYITGWGRGGENLNHSFVLKEVNVPLWRHDRCEASLQLQFGTEYKLPETSICAGADGRDACDGDGGGPLVCRDRSRWYQVGVISFGIGCGRRNVPGVYTRVHSYMTWIYDMVQKHKL